MKIYILTDLEGAAGVVDFKSQGYADGKYYEQAKHLLTQEINASCEAAVAAGADEIIVLDGHGPGGIIYEEIHPEAKLIMGRPLGERTFCIDESFDALFLLAHHSMVGTEKGNLAHSYSSQTVKNMWLNGEKIGEVGVNVYIAGFFGIPVPLVTGDRAGCLEAQRYVPNIEMAVVKEGLTRTAALCLSPQKARDLIREKTKRALERLSEIKPVPPPKGPYEFVTEYISAETAEGRAKSPDIEMVNAHNVKATD